MLKKIKQFITRPKEYYPNRYIFGYHVLKAFHKAIRKAGLVKKDSMLEKDMFNWALYSLHYKGELIEEEKVHTVTLKSRNDYKFVNSKLVKNNANIKPLHTNWRMLYETILQLQPGSIFEMGCGTGMHLHNLQTLLPNAEIYGVDLSEQQLDGMKKSYPKMKKYAKQADATTPWKELPFKKCDVAFTQAVIMHIHTGEAHLTALENLFKMSKKYVILYESMKNHPFLDDIKKLHAEKRIAWDNMFFYYRINPENGLPTSMICSSVKLPYPELTDYGVFTPKK